MKDQVDALNGSEFQRRSLTAADFSEIDDRFAQAQNGDVKLLYVSPGRLDSGAFNQLARLPGNLVAVDEAHWFHSGVMISLKLFGINRTAAWTADQADGVALTATATPQVADDIRQRLHISEVKTGFERDNLAFKVVQKSG